MPRYRLNIEYDGTPYSGWQIQTGVASVQGELIAAIQKFCGETVKVRGAGRTDAGVHALGQVAHCDLKKAWESYKIREALNFYLRKTTIVVLDCEPVAANFDARFSATGRHYLYRILTRRAPPSLDRDRVWWLPTPLDVEAMQIAAGHLIGRHDFTTFRATACQANSPVKNMDRLDVTTHGNEIHVRASARSFLHNQVRSIVGSLRLVGDRRWQPEDMVKALTARDRTACGPVAPSAGLYLLAVDYDADALQPSMSHPPSD